MLLDIREIQHVTALGRFRNFAKAAESLDISQPALSKSIRGIEASLGVQLFDRRRRGVLPTAFGEIILSSSGPLLRGVDEVLAEIRRVKGLEAGTLRIGAGSFALDMSVAETVTRLAGRYPSLHLRLVLDDWESLTRKVMDGTLDVAVAEVTAAEQESQLSVERLGEHGGVFYCRSGHPLLSRTPLTFENISGFPLAMSPLPGRVAPFFERIGAAGRIDPASGHFLPAITLDSVILMKRAVHETNAISWAPKVLIASELRDGSLAALPFTPPWARLNYGTFRRADRPVTPALEMFLVELRAEEKNHSRFPPPKRVRRKGSVPREQAGTDAADGSRRAVPGRSRAGPS
jgi:DNA-binding transcriptional LysR family regulator